MQQSRDARVPDDVATLARAGEPDRYLAALLAPRARRADLITIAAYIGEVARIPHVASDPRIAAIRLQWWADTIDGFTRGAARTGSPVADTLQVVAARRGLAAADLAAVVEARFVEVDDTPVRDLPALQDYLDNAEGAAFRLAAHVLDAPQTPATHLVLQAAGRAYGLVRVLQSLPRQLARGRLLLPADWPEVAALGDAAARGGDRDRALAAIVARCAAAARGNLDALQGSTTDIPHSLNAAILPCALVEPYLQALERGGTDAMRWSADTAAGLAPLTRVWRLWRAHRRGRI